MKNLLYILLLGSLLVGCAKEEEKTLPTETTTEIIDMNQKDNTEDTENTNDKEDELSDTDEAIDDENLDSLEDSDGEN